MWWFHWPSQYWLTQSIEKHSLASCGMEDRQCRTIFVQPGEWIFSSSEKWDILSSTSPLKFTGNLKGNPYIWCIKPSVKLIVGFQLCKKPKKSDYNIKHLQTEKKIPCPHSSHVMWPCPQMLSNVFLLLKIIFSPLLLQHHCWAGVGSVSSLSLLTHQYNFLFAVSVIVNNYIIFTWRAFLHIYHCCLDSISHTKKNLPT